MAAACGGRARAMRSGRCWSGGLGGRRARRRWRFAAGSCWRRRRAGRARRSRPSWAVTDSTVGKWRGRFARRGLDGLHDEPRPGKPRTISDEDVERVIVKTLEEQPANATHWSTRSMAAATGMSQIGGQPDLAGVRAQAAPDRDVQAVARSAVHRQGPRHRRALPQPARGRGRAVRRREVADPGARPHGAGAAADAGRAGAADPRLHPQRHHQPLRRARRRLRPGDRRDDAAASRRGVPPLPQPDRHIGAGTPRRARRARQLLDPQDPVDPALAASATRASRSTSRRPTAPGSTSSSAGSPS